MSYKKHLFICTNGNPDDPKKCASKGAVKLFEQIKEKTYQEYDPKQVRINRSGCLGYCEKGISAVLYPEAHWFYELKLESTPIVFEALKESISKDSISS